MPGKPKAPVESKKPRKKSTKKEQEDSPPVSEFRLTLPDGIAVGSGISATFSEEESKARGYELPVFEGGSEDQGFLDGMYHGLVEKIQENLLTVLWVFPNGDEPGKSTIDLDLGMDLDEGAAVVVLKASPIPKVQLLKWKAKGLANASSRPEEELEEAEETEEDEVEYE